MHCGAGKTEVFMSIVKTMLEKKPELRILVLLNKVKLLEQTARRFSVITKNISIFCGSLNEKSQHENVVIATIQSILKEPKHYDLLIVDEAHRMSESYFLFLDELKNINKKIKTVGFTATPFINGKKIYGEKDSFFKNICYERGIGIGIDEGYLVKPILKKSLEEFDTSKLRTVMGDFDQKQVRELTLNLEKSESQIQDALNKSVDRKKIIWFCANIDHVESVCNILKSYGEDCAAYHSEMSQDERISAENKFEKTDCRHLVFVTIVSEGYDFSPIDCVVILRPTRSATLYVQVVGRALRLHEGKKDALILDYGQVVKNCGPLDNPILKNNFNKTLQEKIEERNRSLKLCKQCLTYNALNANTCVCCGAEFETNKLTEKNDTESSLFFNSKINIKNITKVSLCYHKSKSGSDCARIDYNYKNDEIFDKYDLVHSEYFSLNSDFAVKKLIHRFMILKYSGKLITDVNTLIEHEKNSLVTFAIPKEIELEIDKKNPKYKKISKIIL